MLSYRTKVSVSKIYILNVQQTLIDLIHNVVDKNRDNCSNYEVTIILSRIFETFYTVRVFNTCKAGLCRTISNNLKVSVLQFFVLLP